MSFELPHKEDLATNAKLCGYLTENAEAIEQEDAELRKLIDDLNKRLDELVNGGGM